MSTEGNRPARPTTVSKKRHRFQRVGERVANLQTELQLHVKTNATEISLSFREELGLQGELTTIESFQLLYRKLQPLCTTTPQLLFHVKKIVKLLTAELQAEPVVDIQRERMLPLLKLLTALARELRREFYPLFAGVLPHIIAVIDTKDPELSTQVFKTLTMLFNILRVQLLKDMDAVHQCYFPLLGHPKPFVREFAAQTLSVLLRRIDDPKDLRKYLAAYLKALARGSGKDNEILRDGSAKLFFALIKNVSHGFHSRMNEIFVALLGSFRPKDGEQNENDDDDERALVYDIVGRTSDLMVKYTDADHAHEMLDCFALVLQKMVAKGDRHAANDLYLARITTILLALVRFKSARLLTPNPKSVQLLHETCAALLAPEWVLVDTCEALRDVMMRMFEAVWRLVPAESAVVTAQVSKFFQASQHEQVAMYWQSELLAMMERVLLHSYSTVQFVRTCVFPNAMQLAMETLLEKQQDEQGQGQGQGPAAFAVLVGRLGAYAASHDDVADGNACIVLRDGQRFLTHPVKDHAQRASRVLEIAQQTVNDALESPADADKVALAWKMVRAVALIDVAENKRLAFATPLLKKVESMISNNKTQANGDDAWRVLGAELWRVQQIATSATETTPKKANHALIWQALQGQEHSYAMLSALSEYLKMQTRDKQQALLPASSLEDAERLLSVNLRSATRAIRLVTLQILSYFGRLSFLPSEEEHAALLEGECDLLDHALAAETLCASVSVDVDREIVRHITRIKILARSKQTPAVYKQLAVHHLHGLYHVKFATLWTHVADAIAEIVSLEFPLFWPSVRDEMWAASTRAEMAVASSSSTTTMAAAAPPVQSIEHLEKDASVVTCREFQNVCRLERGELDPMQVTDTLMHHNLLWKGMEKFVDALETKTKFFVPLFLLFLRDQYATLYTDELDDTKRMQLEETLVKSQQLEVGQWIATKYTPPQHTSAKAVRQRTLDYLKLFAAFKNMKGAFANALLHDLFFDLFLMKADDSVSKLALQCLFGFGKKHLGAYKAQLNRIADSGTFREELTTFHIAPEAGIVLHEHRAALLPVLMRLLYAKAVSKKGRNAGDTVGARRAAILSYLAALPPQELVFFIELVVRAFECDVHQVNKTHVDDVANVGLVQSSRVLGFLNLLDDLIGQLGVHLVAFVPTLADIVLSVLTHNYKERDDELLAKQQQQQQQLEGGDVEMADEGEEQEQEQEEEMSGRASGSGTKSFAMRKQIRTLAFRRLGELVDKYDDRVDLTPWVTRVLSVSNDAILHLPGAVVGANKASAMLQFVVSVAGGERVRRVLSVDHVSSVIKCLSSSLSTDASTSEASMRGISPEILAAVLQFLSAMLDGDEKEDATIAQWQLIPHIPFLLAQFVTRFQSKAARYAQEKYAGSSKRELGFLCRVSLHVSSSVVTEETQQSAFDLFQLLLPFLQRNHRSSQADLENILQVLTRLVPLLADPTRHVASLAKLLAPGPNGLTDRSVRGKLIDVFGAIGSHPLSRRVHDVAVFLGDANAFDAKKIEEVDYETRMAALSKVNQQEFASFVDELALLTPVVAQFTQCMHETEYTLRSTALAGLTTLVRMCADAMATLQADAPRRIVLLNVLESLVMPCVRFSVKVPSEDVRRGFVMLLGTLADHAQVFAPLAFVPTDLAVLRRADDVEVDFFYNLTHIQVHRKRRALQKLSALMNEMADAKKEKEVDIDVVMMKPQAEAVEQEGEEMEDDEDEPMTEVEAQTAPAAATAAATPCFSNSTVNNLLLPLVLHFIYEAQAKSQDSLRFEAALCVGASAGLLGWSHYLALLRRLLKSIDGHAEMESSIISSICSVIDHHHFTSHHPGSGSGSSSITGWQAVKTTSLEMKKQTQEQKQQDEVTHAQAYKVQDQLETHVLPMLKKYLFKAVTAKGAQKLTSTTSFDSSVVASKDVVVRVPLALAVVKVLRRLRVSAFYLEFPKLLVSFIKLLKSKQEDIRSSARVTLVKIVDEMGTAYLLPIVEELRHTLQEASTHVLAYTLHTILDKVSTFANPKKPQSLLLESQDESASTDFGSDLDACLPSMLDIIVDDLFQNVVENQDGSVHKSKTKEAKSTSKSYDALELLTKSITFLPNPSIHEIVNALVRKFQENPENAKSVQIFQEALRRVALGLVKNSGIEKSYVFLYAYNVMETCLETIRPMTDAEKTKYKASSSRSCIWMGGVVSAWQVNEKSDKTVKQLAKRVRARDAAKVHLQSKMTGFNRHEIDDHVLKQSRTHLDELLSFAAYLLFAFVRATTSSSSSQSESETQTTGQLIDPLVPQLMRCASESKNDRAVVHALKCLSVLLNDSSSSESLPSLDVALGPLVDRLFKILQKAGAATRGNEMVQTCYRTLTIVLRHKQDFRLTEAQLRVIVSFVRADLDETDHQNATYALLKSIIASRLVIPEIYDVVLRVGEILVQTDTQSARVNCASIFITFLLEYPLGVKRLTQHLTFLMKNLQFEYESGRRAVLETLTALIKKLPLDILNEKAQFFLLPLVLRLANDESQTCKELAAAAIATLVKRLGNQALNECLALTTKWWQNRKDKKLLATAAQVTSLVLNCRPEFMERHAVTVLTSAYTELKSHADSLTQEDAGGGGYDSDDGGDRGVDQTAWPLVVHLLTTVERMSECLIATYESWLLTPSGLDWLTKVLPVLVEYPQARVRHAALTVFKSYVARRDVETLAFRSDRTIKKLTPQLTSQAPLYFQTRGELFKWSNRVSRLLEKPQVAVELAEDVLVVVSWLCGALRVHEASITQDVNGDVAVVAEIQGHEEEEEEPEQEEHKARLSEDEDDEVETAGADAQSVAVATAEEEEKEKQQSKTPLGWMLTRLSYVARGSSSVVVKTTIFKLFAAFIQEQQVETVQKFIVQMMNPLYRAAVVLHEKKKDDAAALLMMASSRNRYHANRAPQEPPQSALLAQEVLERLEQKIGANAFLEAYTFVQRKLSVFRATRREKRKRDLMNDPQLAAKRKIQKNDTKKRAKQMKKRKFAVHKGTASAATRVTKIARPGAN